MSKLIHELPWKVRFNLSLLLDQQEPPNHTWKSLIGELDNLQISSIEVNAVERQGQIPGKSPTEVLLNTLEHKNYTIDDIYRGLHKMEHRRAMDIISKHGAHAHWYLVGIFMMHILTHTVSPEVKKELEEYDLKQAQGDGILSKGISWVNDADDQHTLLYTQMSLYNYRILIHCHPLPPVAPVWKLYRPTYSHSHSRIWLRQLKTLVHNTLSVMGDLG